MKYGQLAMRCLKGDIRIGAVHETVDSATKTMCGKRIDRNWWINGHGDPDIVTCRDCRKRRTHLEFGEIARGEL